MIRKTKYYLADQTIPYRNLAIEEYLLNTVEKGTCILYLWQNRHTVVIGRNQNCWKECRIDMLEEEDGYLARRLSGGGAVYHDWGNLNFTFLAHKEDYDVQKQLQVITEAVRFFGINAEQTGRNDIIADGRKFSGNAFHQSSEHCYHHGTIMVNVNMDYLSRYLNVSLKKMHSKGINSVRARVINLAELNSNITIASMSQALLQAFGNVYGFVPIPIENLDEVEIKRLTTKYESPDWKFGTTIAFNCEMEEQYEWGGINLQYTVNKGNIASCNIYSDAMDSAFILLIQKALIGCIFHKENLLKQLHQLPAETTLQEQMLCDIENLIRASL